jgi:hypothetical protein
MVKAAVKQIKFFYALLNIEKGQDLRNKCALRITGMFCQWKEFSLPFKRKILHLQNTNILPKKS